MSGNRRQLDVARLDPFVQRDGEQRGPVRIVQPQLEPIRRDRQGTNNDILRKEGHGKMPDARLSEITASGVKFKDKAGKAREAKLDELVSISRRGQVKPIADPRPPASCDQGRRGYFSLAQVTQSP